MVLNFKVENQIITRLDNNKVVQDSQNYLYAKLTYSEDWTGEKTMVFRGKSGKAFNMLLDSEDTCLVPWEVLTEDRFEVSAFCGDLITANVVRIDTIRSGYEIGEESRIPTPDIYNQIIEKINDIEQGTVDPEVVAQVVDEYLADKDFVTEADVDVIVATYVTEHKEELKGDTGPAGPQGPAGPSGSSGPAGADGFSPTVTVKTSTSDTYVLTITDTNGSYDTPNLKGSGGGGGGQYDDADWVDLATYITRAYSSGSLKILRKGNTVCVNLGSLKLDNGSGGWIVNPNTSPIPQKYWPAELTKTICGMDSGSGPRSQGYISVNAEGGVYWTAPSSVAGDTLTGVLTYLVP